MSPGSPDASDELQVIPRRPSGSPPAPVGPGGAGPQPSQPPEAPADPVRQKRLARIVTGIVGGCALLLIAAGIARAVRPHEALPAPAPSASAAAAPPAPTPAPTPTETAAPAPPPPPTTGTLLLDRPASPGKVWLDGKKVTAKSFETPCGKHQLKVGPYGKAKSVNIPCGGELHVSH